MVTPCALLCLEAREWLSTSASPNGFHWLVRDRLRAYHARQDTLRDVNMGAFTMQQTQREACSTRIVVKQRRWKRKQAVIVRRKDRQQRQHEGDVRL